MAHEVLYDRTDEVARNGALGKRFGQRSFQCAPLHIQTDATHSVIFLTAFPHQFR